MKIDAPVSASGLMMNQNAVGRSMLRMRGSGTKATVCELSDLRLDGNCNIDGHN